MASNYPRECNGSNANYCFDRAVLVLGMREPGGVGSGSGCHRVTLRVSLWPGDKLLNKANLLLAQQYHGIDRQRALRRNPRSQQPQQQHR
jgi:hypothetical protein